MCRVDANRLPPSGPQAGPELPTESTAICVTIGLLPVATGIGLSVVLHFVLPLLAGPYYSRLAMDAGIAIVLAVSLNIVNGMTGQFSMGHAGFMTLGGYTAGTLTFYGSLLLRGSAAKFGGFCGAGELLFAVSCLAGGGMAAAAGWVVGLPSLRLRGDYLAIVTLGFGEILRVMLQQSGKVIDDVNGLRTAGLSAVLSVPVGGAVGFDGLPGYANLFWVYSLATVTLIVAWRLKTSSTGRAMISVREDEIAAQAMGVDIARQKILAFVLAAFFAGMAGGVLAHESGVILSPKDAGFQRSFEYVIMTVLGGRGSVSGVTLAAVVLTVLPELLRDFEQYRLIVFALLLIGMMLVRPEGLFGIHEIGDVVRSIRRWSGREAT